MRVAAVPSQVVIEAANSKRLRISSRGVRGYTIDAGVNAVSIELPLCPVSLRNRCELLTGEPRGFALCGFHHTQPGISVGYPLIMLCYCQSRQGETHVRTLGDVVAPLHAICLTWCHVHQHELATYIHTYC
jgi:hypothetical protein